MTSSFSSAAPDALDSATSAPTLGSIFYLLEQEGLLVGATDDLKSDARPVSGAACDSRCVAVGNIFFCKGKAFKPDFLQGALERGAIAYICEEALANELASLVSGIPAYVVSNMRRAMALVSAEVTQHPDKSLPLVGITGTKGKSTTAYMLRSIIDTAYGEAHCGIIGSIDTYDGVEDIESKNTTPEAPDLWRHLAHSREAALNAMVLEVSSQAIKYDRTLGVEFDVAAFLNIGRDHISSVEHPDFEDYFASKLGIFNQCRRSVVNLGTTHLDRVLAAAHSPAHTNVAELVCVSAAGPDPVECGSCDMVFPDIWATDIEAKGTSLSFVARGTYRAERGAGEAKKGDSQNGSTSSRLDAQDAWKLPITISFPGLFNVENALVAIACACMLGIDYESIARGLASCRVPGRMELIGNPHDKVLCVVDYAHNALSFQKFFASMAKEFPQRRIIALFGAPGDKAQERRVELPQEAAKWASHIIITEDDPGYEPNEKICAEIAANIPDDATLADGTPVSHEIILDRQEAIFRCLDIALASKDDALICLLAKGDETLVHRGDEFVAKLGDSDIYRIALKQRGMQV